MFTENFFQLKMSITFYRVQVVFLWTFISIHFHSFPCSLQETPILQIGFFFNSSQNMALAIIHPPASSPLSYKCYQLTYMLSTWHTKPANHVFFKLLHHKSAIRPLLHIWWAHRLAELPSVAVIERVCHATTNHLECMGEYFNFCNFQMMFPYDLLIFHHVRFVLGAVF